MIESEIVNNISISWYQKISLLLGKKNNSYGYIKANKKNYKDSYEEITNEKDACQVLNFFDKEFLKRTVLTPFASISDRRYEYQSNISVKTTNEKIQSFWGIDLWLRSSEKIHPQKTIKELVYTSQPTAAQIKLFSIINYQSPCSLCGVNCNIKYEVTLWASGIGYEQGISISLGKDF
jgi:hypothetical protein